ncbi:MAG: PqqD family peptide modification chaperone [Porphyrobacter sp.]|nr:PqqD family peptide modification chaperone [Porphyrobacter sp.]
MMQVDQIFVASDDVVSREVAGEVVLLDLASGEYFGLNAVGGRVWSRLTEAACSIRELSLMIESEFAAPYEQIEQDISALVSDLAEKGLIRRA